MQPLEVSYVVCWQQEVSEKVWSWVQGDRGELQQLMPSELQGILRLVKK